MKLLILLKKKYPSSANYWKQLCLVLHLTSNLEVGILYWEHEWSASKTIVDTCIIRWESWLHIKILVIFFEILPPKIRLRTLIIKTYNLCSYLTSSVIVSSCPSPASVLPNGDVGWNSDRGRIFAAQIMIKWYIKKQTETAIMKLHVHDECVNMSNGWFAACHILERRRDYVITPF